MHIWRIQKHAWVWLTFPAICWFCVVAICKFRLNWNRQSDRTDRGIIPSTCVKKGLLLYLQVSLLCLAKVVFPVLFIIDIWGYVNDLSWHLCFCEPGAPSNYQDPGTWMATCVTHHHRPCVDGPWVMLGLSLVEIWIVVSCVGWSFVTVSCFLRELV